MEHPNERITQQYSAEMLHEDQSTVSISEAEDIILSAYNDVRRAERDPQFYRRLDFFRALRGMVEQVLSGDGLAESEEPEEKAIAEAIAAYLAKTGPAKGDTKR